MTTVTGSENFRSTRDGRSWRSQRDNVVGNVEMTISSTGRASSTDAHRAHRLGLADLAGDGRAEAAHPLEPVAQTLLGELALVGSLDRRHDSRLHRREPGGDPDRRCGRDAGPSRWKSHGSPARRCVITAASSSPPTVLLATTSTWRMAAH